MPGAGLATALVACAAGGFLAYHLAGAPRPTLHAAPAPAAQAPASAPAEAAPGSSPPVPKVPEVLPPLALPGLDGRLHRLSDWKDRMLLVNFWASWCEPCRREIPLLRSLRSERAEDRLEVVGIAIDFRDTAQKYARDSGIDYPVLVGEQGGLEAVAAFGMDPVLPFSVFADRAGRVIALKVGELHRDDADLILDRMRDLDRGRLTLAAAREQIATGITRLNMLRSAPAGGAAQ
ncbi:MAG: TlpA family protein disulfide reductase [Gammaproteobacteria bacterium]|nr:MAG: TlpA family protein disulfide reductase [Gammaproteobacteria bacterium]